MLVILWWWLVFFTLLKTIFRGVYWISLSFLNVNWYVVGFRRFTRNKEGYIFLFLVQVKIDMGGFPFRMVSKIKVSRYFLRNDLRDCGWCSGGGGEGDIKMRREVNGGKGKVFLVACVLWRFLKRFASRSLRGGSLTAWQRLFSRVYSFFECLSWLFIEWLHWGLCLWGCFFCLSVCQEMGL